MSKKQSRNDSSTIIKNFEVSDEKLAEKIVDLCLLHQLNSSNYTIRLIRHQINFYELQISHLVDSKPFWFQKKKLKAHYEEIEKLENNIIDCCKKIEEEQDSVSKIKKHFPDYVDGEDVSL